MPSSWSHRLPAAETILQIEPPLAVLTFNRETAVAVDGAVASRDIA
jgi:hypothetical protein